MSGLHFVQIVLATVALVLIAFFVYLPWRNWRRLEAGQDDKIYQSANDRRSLIAFLTIGLNLFFLVFVVATFVPMLAINSCR